MLFKNTINNAFNECESILRTNKDYSYELYAELRTVIEEHAKREDPAKEHNTLIQEFSSVLDMHDCSKSVINQCVAILKDLFTLGMFGYWKKLNDTHTRFEGYKKQFIQPSNPEELSNESKNPKMK